MQHNGYQQQQAFSFPMLSSQEILNTWEDVPLQAKDLDKPTPAAVRTIYETLCEQCIGPCVREEMYNPDQEAMAHVEFPELHEESISQLTFFRYISQLLLAAGVDDFSLEDLTRPDPKRFKRNLCAIINFQKFRLQCIENFEPLHAESQELVDSYMGLHEEINQLQDQISHLQEQRAAQRDQIRELHDECRTLDSDIKDRSAEKDRLEQESKQLKNRKEELKDYTNTLKFQKIQINSEKTRLEEGIVSSPERLKSELCDQRKLLETERNEKMRLESELEELNKRTQILTETDAKSKELLELINKVEVAMDDCKAAAKEERRMTTNLKEHDNSLLEMKNQKAELEQQAKLSKDRLEQLTSTKALKLAAASHALKECTVELDQLRSQKDDLEEKTGRENDAIAENTRLIEKTKEAFNSEVEKRRDALRRLDTVIDRSSENLFAKLSYS